MANDADRKYISKFNNLIWGCSKSESSTTSSSVVSQRSTNAARYLEFYERRRQRDNACKNNLLGTSGVACYEILNEDVLRGGYVVGKKYTLRDCTTCYEKIRKDYFVNNPRYSPNTFRCRFRMRKEIFLHMYYKLKKVDPFFKDRPNATGRPGIFSLQKILCALRMLATGLSRDNLDKYFQIADITATSCLKKLCQVVYEEYSEEFHRIPNEQDIKRILAQNAARGFLGMLGSIDCMHWGWKHYPTTWVGQFRGHVKTPTTILEVVADQDLWIWHVFFGMSGSHNDLNVLQRSNVLEPLEEGTTTKCEYTVNDNKYTQGYYLANGIYPN